MVFFGAGLRLGCLELDDFERDRRGAKGYVQLDAEDLDGREMKFYVYSRAVIKWIVSSSTFYSRLCSMDQHCDII